ncbi:DUF58 domain-containing protein [Pseudonocardia broussonetiae]|uniref:DUF58 domain-containing protein n=1 Tax=Pseudonocardia broussonetiae TaxID=2736640 RepID=A0A6M6JIN9_9PSEU|nr:DUF58 domain-containing protein [Pseudonocardia broussonetiae]QJY47934.1 DUF58 domain-containing protein [Pseudonocardia broussonetiae]
MRLTARGVALLVCATVLLAAGVLLGLPVLRALAGVAAGAVLVAVVPALGRLRPSITRELHPDRVQRGTPAVAQLVVANPTDSRQSAFTAVERIGNTVQEIEIRSLPARGSTRRVYDLPTGRRGRIVVGPLVVQRSDLLGLARSRGEIGGTAELWVYPRRHAVRLAPAGRSRHHHEGDPPPFPMAGSMDMRSLREYVVGDEPRHLHWKATARTGQLMVREYVDPAQPWCVVVLDDRASALSPEAFDEAVEVAASILWESCEQDRPSLLCTTSGVVVDTAGGAVGARTVLDRLCELRQSDRPDRPLDPAVTAGRRGDGWFVHVGGIPSASTSVLAGRFGRGVAVDLSGTGSHAPTGGRTPTIIAVDAESAIGAWNAMAVR